MHMQTNNQGHDKSTTTKIALAQIHCNRLQETPHRFNLVEFCELILQQQKCKK